jgi:hypothetical protein
LAGSFTSFTTVITNATMAARNFPLDKWFGTYHDGTEEMTAVIRDRKRRMHAK